jgi:hypothetical protein
MQPAVTLGCLHFATYFIVGFGATVTINTDYLSKQLQQTCFYNGHRLCSMRSRDQDLYMYNLNESQP